MPSAITIRGVTPQGDAAETFTIARGKARWKSPGRRRHARATRIPAFYVSQGGPIDTTAWFLEALLASPDTVARAPARRQSASGEADRLSKSAPARRKQTSRSGRSPASAPRRCRSGPTRTTSSSASRSACAGCRRHTPASTSKIEEAQAKAMAAQAPALAKSLVKMPAGAGGVHGRPALRRRRDAVPRRPDGRRRQGRHRRRRRSRVGQGAGGRAGHRRPRQDA